MCPVRPGEVVEGEQLLAIARQARGGLGVLPVVAFDPVVEGALGPGTAASISRRAPVRMLRSVSGSETAAGAASETTLSLLMCGVLLF